MDNINQIAADHILRILLSIEDGSYLSTPASDIPAHIGGKDYYLNISSDGRNARVETPTGRIVNRALPVTSILKMLSLHDSSN